MLLYVYINEGSKYLMLWCTRMRLEDQDSGHTDTVLSSTERLSDRECPLRQQAWGGFACLPLLPPLVVSPAIRRLAGRRVTVAWPWWGRRPARRRTRCAGSTPAQTHRAHSHTGVRSRAALHQAHTPSRFLTFLEDLIPYTYNVLDDP